VKTVRRHINIVYPCRLRRVDFHSSSNPSFTREQLLLESRSVRGSLVIRRVPSLALLVHARVRLLNSCHER
jgi:hypothetical protein